MNKWMVAFLRMAIGSWLLLSPGTSALASINTVREGDLGSWSVVSSPTTSNLNEVEILSPNDGWAVAMDARSANGTIGLKSRARYQRPVFDSVVAADDGWIVGEASSFVGDRSTRNPAPRILAFLQRMRRIQCLDGR
jgi:photosystem II stability/assembly factor-like uncharacterized protein